LDDRDVNAAGVAMSGDVQQGMVQIMSALAK
jgi:hypothetical protein